jgi:hypothetical protein
MFYHHAESECRRQPPTRDSTAEVIAKLAGLIYPAARDGKAGDDLYAAHRHAQWPVVEETDFCGEFQRGSALLPETLEEQKLHDPSPEEDE